MKHRHEEFSKIVTLMGGAVLLFVVLFPYTPTPIALSIEKALVAVIVLGSCLLFTRTFPLSIGQHGFLNFSPRFSFSDHVLDLICVRLR